MPSSAGGAAGCAVGAEGRQSGAPTSNQPRQAGSTARSAGDRTQRRVPGAMARNSRTRASQLQSDALMFLMASDRSAIGRRGGSGKRLGPEAPGRAFRSVWVGLVWRSGRRPRRSRRGQIAVDRPNVRSRRAGGCGAARQSVLGPGGPGVSRRGRSVPPGVRRNSPALVGALVPVNTMGTSLEPDSMLYQGVARSRRRR